MDQLLLSLLRRTLPRPPQGARRPADPVRAEGMIHEFSRISTNFGKENGARIFTQRRRVRRGVGEARGYRTSCLFQPFQSFEVLASVFPPSGSLASVFPFRKFVKIRDNSWIISFLFLGHLKILGIRSSEVPDFRAQIWVRFGLARLCENEGIAGLFRVFRD